MSDIVERRMDAYYYSFVPTGVAAVDKVLGAVACAGKAYHHTDDWCVDTPAYDDHTGPTPVDWIQNAAFEVAAEITALRAEVERLRAALEDVVQEATEHHAENVSRAELGGSDMAQRKAKAIVSRSGVLLHKIRFIARAALKEKPNDQA